MTKATRNTLIFLVLVIVAIIIAACAPLRDDCTHVQGYAPYCEGSNNSPGSAHH